MNIKHPKYGEVEGAEATSKYMWEENGAVYYRNHGWSEVPEKRWVEAPSHRIVEEHK